VTPPGAILSLWLTERIVNGAPLNGMMSQCVNDFFIPVSMTLILLGLWFGARSHERRKHDQRGVLCGVIGLGLSNGIVWIINQVSNPWPRPFILYPDSAGKVAKALFYLPTDPSFPCNAAAVAFAMATGVWLVNRKAGVILYALASLWAFARFYCGVHYFIDIVVGALIGVIVSYIIFKFVFPRIEKAVLTPLFGFMRRLHLA
jgi:undecaprenyl-diphosphatase